MSNHSCLHCRNQFIYIQNPSQPPSVDIECIGIILVHGVGEQTRFEHLDAEVRKLVDALQAMPEYKQKNGGNVVVEIAPAAASGFQAEQDVWHLGPGSTVRVIATSIQRTEKRFHFHEVWWADVNERYSVVKQIRFWLWGLTVWKYPLKERSDKKGADYVYPPEHSGGRLAVCWTRARLLGVAIFFVAVGFSIGIAIFILKRLFEIETPTPLKTITNYVSGVKLYNQPRRLAPGIVRESDDFLDSIDEAPRYSIRRRMIRALSDVATSGYSRWYVLGHSLGSAVAFNGLMETAYSWPGYLDEWRWRRLKALNMAGPLARGAGPIPAETVPRRPSWCGDDIAYRTRIFERFRGLLTYGSPLEKFAAIWPARVPIAREPAFHPNAVWVNIFDPIDPISGVLTSFDQLSPACCPHPQNVGYRAGPVLLWSHIQYLSKTDPGYLSSAIVKWLLGSTNEPGSSTNSLGGHGYKPFGREYWIRDAVAWSYWIVFFALLIALAGIAVPIVLKLIVAASNATTSEWMKNTDLNPLSYLDKIILRIKR